MSATALESGIECVMCTSSIVNGPSSTTSPSSTSLSSTSRSLCSSSLERAMAIVSAPPYTGARWLAQLAQHPRQAPRWSSWPCVTTIASMSLARSRR